MHFQLRTDNHIENSEELADRVRAQATLQPALYGDVDFDAQPYRLATGRTPPSRSFLGGVATRGITCCTRSRENRG